MSWQHANTGIDNALLTTVIVLHPTQKKFASIYGAGVVQSPDLGHTWSNMNTGLEDKFVHALVQGPCQSTIDLCLDRHQGSLPE